MKQPNYYAFFDLDDTIFNSNTGKIIARESYNQKIMNLKDIFGSIVLSIFYRTGILPTDFIYSKWTEVYTNLPEKKVRKTIEDGFLKKGIAMIRPEIISEIAKHRANGAKIVIHSASLKYICEAAQKHLKLDDIICTEFEVIDGILTGKLKGLPNYGEQKAVNLKKYSADKKISLENAYYYGDSRADIPVMKIVGHPICVNPDKKLKKMATSSGWPILVS